MKRRSLTLVLCLLATLSLASVGFASWVISAGDTETATGSFVVETVQDKRLSVTVTPVQDSVNFTAPKPETGWKDTDWLTADENAKKEQLTAQFTVVVKYNDGGQIKSSEVNVTGSVADISEIKYSDNGTSADPDDDLYLVNAPVVETVLNATESLNQSKTVNADATSENLCVLVYTVTVTFTWGNFFDSENPYVYYNKKTHDADSGVNVDGEEGNETWADHALYILGTKLKALENKQFTLTISANPVK